MHPGQEPAGLGGELRFWCRTARYQDDDANSNGTKQKSTLTVLSQLLELTWIIPRHKGKGGQAVTGNPLESRNFTSLRITLVGRSKHQMREPRGVKLPPEIVPANISSRVVRNAEEPKFVGSEAICLLRNPAGMNNQKRVDRNQVGG